MTLLSDRIRPNVEAAPWVIDEVRRLEQAAQAALNALVWEAGSEPALYATQTRMAIDALRTLINNQQKPTEDRHGN